MATARVVTEAVELAVQTATVDLDAPGEERCRFGPAALDAVVRLCDSSRNLEIVLAAVDVVLQRSVNGLEPESTLAAVTLRARVEAAAVRRQVPVENLQGDVGTGGGGLS